MPGAWGAVRLRRVRGSEMASSTTTPVAPACLRVALCAALILVSALAAPPPASAQVEPRFDVLVFSKTTGFRHTEAIDAGRAAIAQMGTASRTSPSRATEDAAVVHRRRDCATYEVVVFLNTDGEGILNADQRTAFERWMQRGGGLVGIHADANADRDWAWTTDMMGGALFPNHPAGELQFQNGTVSVEDADAPRDADAPGRMGARGRVVQLHRRAARQGPRPRHARREHLRRAGRQRRRPTTTRSPGARTTTAAATSTPRSATTARYWQEPRLPRAHPAARSSGRPARPRATAARRARACRPTRRSTRSRSTTTPRTRWRSPSRPTAASTTSSWPARSSTTTPPTTASP